MLTSLMAFRKAARQLFQKYQIIIEIIFKFIISFEAYSRIVESVDYNATLSKIVFKMGFGVAGAILPPMVTILLCMLVAVYEVFSGSPIMAVLALAVFVVLYCFAARFSGKFAYAIVAIPLLVKFNLHYIVALLLGMTATPLAIFPAGVGVITYYIFGAINNSMTTEKLTSMDDILALYMRFMGDIFANKEMFYVVAIFAAVIIIMWALRKLRFGFVFEITILAGGLLMIFGHVFAGKYVTMSVPTNYVVWGTIISMLLVYIVQFFHVVLDYTAVEYVQFEDDDYYYYVHAVPKLDRGILEEVKPSEEAMEAEKRTGITGFFRRLREDGFKKSIFTTMFEQSKKEKHPEIMDDEDENAYAFSTDEDSKEAGNEGEEYEAPEKEYAESEENYDEDYEENYEDPNGEYTAPAETDDEDEWDIKAGDRK